VVKSQTGPDSNAMVEGLFTVLMGEIKMNIEVENREKFMGNVTSFRLEMKALIDLNSFYKVILQYTTE